MIAAALWPEPLLEASYGSVFAPPPVLPPVVRPYVPRSDVQRRFDESRAFECFFAGGKARGATHAALFKQLRWVHRPSFKVIFLRVDNPSMVEALDRVDKPFTALGAVWDGQNKRYVFPSGARYEFGYGETRKDIRRYQGRQPSRIVYDEAGQVTDERVIDILRAEIRTEDPEIQPGMDLTANPGGPGEPWQITRYIKPCGARGARVWADPDDPTNTRAFFFGTVDDNPEMASTGYGNRLRNLPTRLRQQLLHGLFGLGVGRALEELSERHFVPRRPVPPHWTVWGAFDWGFAHPAVFGWFAKDEGGTTYLVDSVHMHRRLPDAQASRIKESGAAGRALALVYAGHDAFHKHVAQQGETVPTIAETFAKSGILLSRASIARVQGLNNLREYVKCSRERPDGTVEAIAPAFRIMDTPGNRLTFACLEAMVVDPKDPEDALKKDADGDTGEGGDDAYDMVRYGLAARPYTPRDPALDAPKSAFDPEAVELYRKHVTTVRELPPPEALLPYDPHHGDY